MQFKSITNPRYSLFIYLLLIINAVTFFNYDYLSEFFLSNSLPVYPLTGMRVIVALFSICILITLRIYLEIKVILFISIYIIFSSFYFTEGSDSVYYYAIHSICAIGFYSLPMSIYKMTGKRNLADKAIVFGCLIFILLSFVVELYDVERFVSNSETRAFVCGSTSSPRWCGATNNPNVLAASSLFIFIFSCFYGESVKSLSGGRIINITLILGSLFLIFASQSRAIILYGLILYFVLFIGHFSKIRHMSGMLVIIFFVGVVFAFTNFFDISFIDDIYDRVSDSSNSARLSLMIGGLELFSDEFSFGIGNNITPNFSRYYSGWEKPIDSFYINILYTQGVFISLIFFIALLLLLMRCYSIRFIDFSVLMSFLVILLIEDHFFKTSIAWFIMYKVSSYETTNS